MLNFSIKVRTMKLLTLYLSRVQRSKFAPKEVSKEVCRKKLNLKKILFFSWPKEAVLEVSACNGSFKVYQY